MNRYSPTNTASYRVRRHRNGIATIELVLFFPILIWLVAMIFSLGFAHLKKSSTFIRSREQAWDLRAPDNQNDPGFARRVLRKSEVNRNQHTETVEREVRLPNVPGLENAGGTVTAESQNSLIMGTWTDQNDRVGLKEEIGETFGPILGIHVGQRYHPHPDAAKALINSPRYYQLRIFEARMGQIMFALVPAAIRGAVENIRLMVEGPKLVATIAGSTKYYIESLAVLIDVILLPVDWPPHQLHGGFLLEAGMGWRGLVYD